jgi:hypothetical protein
MIMTILLMNVEATMIPKAHQKVMTKKGVMKNTNKLKKQKRKKKIVKKRIQKVLIHRLKKEKFLENKNQKMR